MNLKLLGLTDYEEKAYKALVKLGKSAASEVSRESTVPYGKIYVVLESLEAKHLVQVVPEQTKKFIASNPEHLMNILKEKEQEMSSMKEEITNLKKIYQQKDKEVVKIARGKKNFYKIVKNLKIKNYNYTIRYSAEYHPNWVQSVKKNLKKGTDLKALVRHNKETEKDVKKWMKIRKDFKEFKNKGVAMGISEDQVFISLIKSNILLLIEDKPFIDVMKRMFLATYKDAKKVTA